MPKLLVKTMDLNRCVDGIDYIEMLRIPYNFTRLREILKENINEFTDLIDTFEMSGWYTEDQIADFRMIIETVKELNEEYLPIKEYAN